MSIIDSSEKLLEAMKAQGGSCAAYACELKDGEFVVDTGLTLRDHFAGQALTAVIGLTGMPARTPDELWNGSIAAQCYALADAMLAERSKP